MRVFRVKKLNRKKSEKINKQKHQCGRSGGLRGLALASFACENTVDLQACIYCVYVYCAFVFYLYLLCVYVYCVLAGMPVARKAGQQLRLLNYLLPPLNYLLPPLNYLLPPLNYLLPPLNYLLPPLNYLLPPLNYLLQPLNYLLPPLNCHQAGQQLRLLNNHKPTKYYGCSTTTNTADPRWARVPNRGEGSEIADRV